MGGYGGIGSLLAFALAFHALPSVFFSLFLACLRSFFSCSGYGGIGFLLAFAFAFWHSCSSFCVLLFVSCLLAFFLQLQLQRGDRFPVSICSCVLAFMFFLLCFSLCFLLACLLSSIVFLSSRRVVYVVDMSWKNYRNSIAHFWVMCSLQSA
jgi:hypothetical protein